MDIIGRSIPFYADTPDVAVQQWLNLGWDCSGEYFQNYVRKYGKKPSSYHLAKKAVVGIYPNEYFEKILWINPKLKR
jgi:hypothetical protein